MEAPKREEQENVFQKYCLPQRYVVAILSFFVVFSLYNFQVSFHLALRHILPPPLLPDIGNKSIKRLQCPYFENLTPFVPMTSHVVSWHASEISLSKQTFYFSYLITNLVGGILADQFTPRFVTGGALLATSLVSLIAPMVITMGSSACMVMHIMMGLTMGPIFPGVVSMLGRWTPKKRRGRFSSAPFCAPHFAVFFTYIISEGMMGLSGEWTILFYFYGVVGFLAAVIWLAFTRSNPYQSKLATEGEKEYLRKEFNGYVSFEAKSVPWAALLLSLPLWGLVFAQMGHIVMWRFYLDGLFVYMKDSLLMNYSESVRSLAVAYIIGGLVVVKFGFLSDYLISRNHVHVNALRKALGSLGTMGPAIFVTTAAFAWCFKGMTVVIFSVGICLMGAYYAGPKVVVLDLAPNFCGVVMGASNGIGSLLGALLHTSLVKFVPNGYLKEWRFFFIVLVAVCGFASAVFMVFGSAKEQKWNRKSRTQQTK